MRALLKYGTTTLGILFFINVLGQEVPPDKTISHKFYVVGDIGQSNTLEDLKDNLQALNKQLQQAPADNSTLLFLGNNLSKKNLRELINSESGKDSELFQLIQSTVNGFQGKTIFIPGNLDWHAGLQGLKVQEKFIEKLLGKGTFQPENGCPIKKIKINKNTDLLLIDSQWAIMDWDKHPNLNGKCKIKTKAKFYEEIENYLKKGEGKTVFIAAHHPIKSMGPNSDILSFGINPQDLSSEHYKEFSNRIMTISRQMKNVILLGGHDNNLQYFKEKDVPIIISGSGAQSSRVRKNQEGFSTAEVGFTVITQFIDASVWVSFYGTSNDYAQSLYDEEIVNPIIQPETISYREHDTPEYVKESIYDSEKAQKTGLYRAIWGDHYREDYLTKIRVKTALLDTLYGGLTPIRKGGGHQTNSLRLVDNRGKEYTMRSVEKSALRFIQYFLFQTEYLDPEVADTFFVELLQDYWTTANPYGALTIGDLADAIGVLHPNPSIYFIPKQATLGQYNGNFGNKIYYFEEHISDNRIGEKKFGDATEIISTSDLLEKLRSQGDITIDKELYIRTRLFDNLIGDWDRHADQWKWAKKKTSDGKEVYLPIPRDRDQVYSDFDGAALKLITLLNPPLRFMQRYDNDYNHLRWYNDAGDDVDLAVLKNYTQEDWIKQAIYIKEYLTDEIIENAFENLPQEIDQKKVDDIKRALKGRLENIKQSAIGLHRHLIKRPIIIGTDGKDFFEIVRMQNGKTKIKVFKKKKNQERILLREETYDKRNTSEIWIYGLEDEDSFQLKGQGDDNIRIKIIGGNGNDTYQIENKKNIKIYDQKTHKNTFNGKVSKLLSDNYEMNTYQFKNNRRDVDNYTPLLGFEPDDGLGIGLQYTYQKNSLIRNPFTDEHSLKLAYFSSTSSIKAGYYGEFAYIFDKINLGLQMEYSSPNYSDNFFGLGNDTENLDDDLGMDFNRVRTMKFLARPSLILKGYHGSLITLGVSYENIQVERTENRFVDNVILNEDVFNNQDFIGILASYEYDNLKKQVISKSGFGTKIIMGYTSNINNSNSFPYLIGQIRLASKLDVDGRWVLATKVKTHINLNNDFEFYQGATIGGNNGLRGFREQRFTGKTSLYHSTDLRLSLGKLRNGIIPIGMGAYVGFDYGRVWIENDDSSRWHTSYGGGLNFSLSGFTTLNLAYFLSDEGGRIVAGLGLPF